MILLKKIEIEAKKYRLYIPETNCYVFILENML